MGYPHVLARAAVVAGVAAGAALAFATPAVADITVTPEQAVQGTAARLTFRVTNDAARTAITRVRVKLPAEAPIAEVYPLSVSDWAPQMQTRSLATALPGVHGTQQSEITTVVTWIAVNKGLPPGGSAELSLEVGPLPQTDKLAFQIEQTNSDRSVVRYTADATATGAAERPAVVVRLRPPAAGESGHAPVHGGAPNGTQQQAAAPAPEESRSNAWWLAGAMLLIGVIAGLGIARQKRTPPAPESDSSAPDKRMARSSR